MLWGISSDSRAIVGPAGDGRGVERHLRNRPAGPMTTVQKAHEEALKEAKLTPPFRLYDLRHTFGSRSALAVVDLATFKEIMGTSKLSIMMWYVHPIPKHN